MLSELLKKNILFISVAFLSTSYFSQNKESIVSSRNHENETFTSNLSSEHKDEYLFSD